MAAPDELDPVLFPQQSAGQPLSATQSATPILDAARAQVAAAARASGDHLNAGVVLQDGQPGVAVEGSKDLGKGWSVAGVASWARKTGYAAAAMVGWSPRGEREPKP